VRVAVPLELELEVEEELELEVLLEDELELEVLLELEEELEVLELELELDELVPGVTGSGSVPPQATNRATELHSNAVFAAVRLSGQSFLLSDIEYSSLI
jgi:hypothetical protein